MQQTLETARTGLLRFAAPIGTILGAILIVNAIRDWE